MRPWVMCALVALALSGCKLGFEGITALDEYAGDIAAAGEVDRVICQPTTLDLATREAGACIALNAAGTRLSANGTNVVRWESTGPDIVSVDLVGNTQAEVSVGSAWVIARGTNGSADSLQVTVQ